MEKWKLEGFYMPTPTALHVYQCARITPNGAVVASNQAATKSQPPSGKVAKVDHLNMKVKEQVLLANAKANIEFVVATMKSV